ncbi:GNAT family N-acetyltransferase [Nocardiopsis changdeensis]|uniref:GNAT family N-acetyltransferase n=1 Tax=Nocardiopsis changdeensis TaxID=2831969 RepID=A0ABX8BQT0_9ACTN|nr:MULTISPECIES: GNAT family N-acetyltransferase [Nocardiopsis]QUX24085.1 GNAT family N-acetyltransferase [Nocardiopsis changdeensis]QYX34481.1 GNAT family N-acetyltransferase [Nocardiopsis sp. MT53]
MTGGAERAGMIEVVRADALGETRRREVARVFVDGFGPDLAAFSKDPEVLADAIAHMLVPERFYVALVDGEPAGLASLTVDDEECVEPDARTLRRHLGAVRGTIADRVFRSQFQGAVREPREGKAEIGFVASSLRHRGRGAAKAVLLHLLALPGYDEYVLEDIAGNNEAALGLYRRLGFREYRRRRAPYAGFSGIKEYVSMRLVQEHPAQRD